MKKLTWKDVMDSRRYFPDNYHQCRERAKKQGFKYFGFNAYIFSIETTEPSKENSVCSEYDL